RKFDLSFDLAIAEEFHAGLLAAHQTRFHHGRSVDRHLGIDQAGINGGLYLADVDLIEHQGKRRIAEPALRQSPVQGHLAALETLDTHAGARGLSLAAATTRLAHPRADAAPDAHALLARARPIRDLIEFHLTPRSSSRDDRVKPGLRPRAQGAAPCGSCRASPACPGDRVCA